MATKKGDKIGKVTFGVRKKGKHKKFRNPKEKHVKKYRGQGH